VVYIFNSISLRHTPKMMIWKGNV